MHFDPIADKQKTLKDFKCHDDKTDAWFPINDEKQRNWIQNT